MELRVLQYFLAVTKEQSISGAAESLHLSQPTLSRQLKELEDEISLSDDILAGDISIGTGETDGVRFLAKAAKELQKKSPLIHLHIVSGDKVTVTEELDRGLIDFGLIFGKVDTSKYEFLQIPYKDIWGVIMRRDSPLAEKETISATALIDKPLIISHQF